MAPGVFDGISAHLVRQLGFRAAYLTGAGTAASFGLPDIGLVTGSEMAERAAMMAEAVGDLPLIADADTGYGAPVNVVRTVRAYEKAGVATIQLEDKTYQKRSGHLPDKEVISQAEFVAKLAAALDTRTDALISGPRPTRGPCSAWTRPSSGPTPTPRSAPTSSSSRPPGPRPRWNGSPRRSTPRC